MELNQLYMMERLAQNAIRLLDQAGHMFIELGIDTTNDQEMTAIEKAGEEAYDKTNEFLRQIHRQISLKIK